MFRNAILYEKYHHLFQKTITHNIYVLKANVARYNFPSNWYLNGVARQLVGGLQPVTCPLNPLTYGGGAFWPGPSDY